MTRPSPTTRTPRDATHSLDDLLARVRRRVDARPGHARDQGMIGAEQFARMKDGAIYVNTARAHLHDTDALVAALAVRPPRRRRPRPLRGRAPPDRPPAHRMGNVVLTPHIGGATYDTEANHSKLHRRRPRRAPRRRPPRQPRQPGGPGPVSPETKLTAQETKEQLLWVAQEMLRTNLVAGHGRATSARASPTATPCSRRRRSTTGDDARRPRRLRPRRQRARGRARPDHREGAAPLGAARYHDEIDATMHCHAKYATMFALTRQPIPAVHRGVRWCSSAATSRSPTTRRPAPTSWPTRSRQRVGKKVGGADGQPRAVRGRQEPEGRAARRGTSSSARPRSSGAPGSSARSCRSRTR